MQAREVPTIQAQVGTGTALLQGAPSISNGRKPQPNDATRGPCLDLMVHHPCPITPEDAASGNAVPALEFLGAMDFDVIKPGLPGSPSSLSPPIS
jgi:hypothetical protein